ncbi:MAG TPA: peptidoglycan-binding domain-containing protein [Phycisphaerae bacterium]|nr:peptidoglycan-binding domain-containing protein [Phycisphaerae bacterium]
MAATKIRIRFTGVAVMDGVNLKSPEDWKFQASVKRASNNSTTALGDATALFEFKKDNTYNEIGWEASFDLTGADSQFEISVQGTSDTAPPKDLGKVKATLLTPILHNYNLTLTSTKNIFVAYLAVFMTAQTESWTEGITTILQNPDSKTFNTILDQMQAQAVHICPVIPVPWATGIPPLPRGVQHLTASPQEDLSIMPGTTSLNALVNPSVIPVLDPNDKDFPNKWARIRVTQFWPANLDTDKLIWRAATSNIKFWSGGAAKTEVKGGVEVAAYGELGGDNDEMGQITLHSDRDGTPKLATFRAWVGKPKYIWTRANIFKGTPPPAGPPGPDPSVTGDQIATQIGYNNIILWQAGVQMAMDTDQTTYGGAAYQQPGVFQVTTDAKNVVNVPSNGEMLAPLLNARVGVFNVAYIYSAANFPTLNGMATDRLLSDPEGTVNLDGGPSTSWLRPTGVFPDDDGVKITMKRMGPSDKRSDAPAGVCEAGANDKLCGCIMTERGALAAGSLTLAHELCHVLGLHHRGSGGGETTSSYDSVNHQAGPLKGRGHPWNENLLTYGPNTRRQDLDLIQAMVIRSSKLCKSDPPPPPPPKPIPTAYVPTKDDKILLQSYLVGKTPGLKHSGYDLGAYGPDGDGIDGIIGEKTKAAIKQFQADHGGLVKDGIYGPKTRAAFDNEINGT